MANTFILIPGINMEQETINFCRAVTALSDKLAANKLARVEHLRKLDEIEKEIENTEESLRAFNNRLDIIGIHKSINEDSELEEDCKEL